MLVYAKHERIAKTGLEMHTGSVDARYLNRDRDNKLWKAGDVSGPKALTHQGMVCGIQSRFTGKIHYPPTGRCWVFPQGDTKRFLEGWGVAYELRAIDDANIRADVVGVDETEVRALKALVLKTALDQAKLRATEKLVSGPWPKVFFGAKGTGRPQQKRYLEDVKKGRVPMTYWADEENRIG